MSKRYTSRKAARARKSMKMGKEELVDMVKGAVKEALEEGKADDDGDEDDDSIEGVIEAAIEAINEKRKSAKSDELSEDEVGEIMDAVAEYLDVNDDDSKDDDLDDEEKDDDADDEEKDDDEEKGRKSTASSRQRKSARTQVKKLVQRKYSDVYMNRGEVAAKQTQKKEVPASILLARSIKCIDVFGRNDPERAAFYARKHYQDEDMAREFKALSATGPSNGGFLIPEVYMDQVVEMLYPKTVIFELGAQRVPLEHGNLNIPKMTAGTRATWRGEQRKITKTEPKFGNIKLSAKSLGAIVPQSKELMMSTSYSADAIFANDLFRRMQLGLDYGGLYGTGGEFMPLGAYYNKEIEQIKATQVGNTDLADTAGKITADFPVHMRAKAMQKNIDDQFLGWAMNSMLEGYLMNLKTTTGVYIYREEMQTGKLLGSPYKISNQIGVTNGKTDLFFGNWSDMLIGDQMGMETYTTLDGTWTDDEGNSHSCFDENMVATRATMYDDIAVRHGESFLIATDVKVM